MFVSNMMLSVVLEGQDDGNLLDEAVLDRTCLDEPNLMYLQ